MVFKEKKSKETIIESLLPQEKTQALVANDYSKPEVKDLQSLADHSQQTAQLEQIKTVNPEENQGQSSGGVQPTVQLANDGASGDPVDLSGFFKKKMKEIDGKLQPDKPEQFESDVQIWLHTLNQDIENLGLSEEEKKVHREQIQNLERDLISRAFLGVQGKDKKSGEFKNIEDVMGEVPLASLMSHGDRHAYQSGDMATGQEFRDQMIFGGNDKDNVKIEGPHRGRNLGRFVRDGGTRALDPKNREEGVHAGLYERASSHGQHRGEDGQWVEDKGMGAARAGDDSWGMNIPLGGIGNTVETKGGVKKIGSEGRTLTEGGKAIAGHQHGHAYYKHDEDAKGTSLMVGYEGSAPSQDSLFGSHGLKSMMKKGGNDSSLTGQSKGKDMGMSLGKGGVKSEVTSENLEELKTVFRYFEQIKKQDPEMANQIREKLLRAKNDEERKEAAKRIKTLGEITMTSATTSQD